MKRAGNNNDIKAEVVVGTAIREGFSEIKTEFDGCFKRDYQNDIHSASYVNTAAKKLDIKLSRKSLYDTLPEMLFHKHYSKKSGQEIDNMIGYSKKVKLEEKSARLFLAPFDTAMFLSKVNIEIEEQDLLYSLENRFLEQHLHHLYHITQESKSKADLHKVIKLIPYAQLIAGNYNYLKEVLVYVTGEKVEIGKSIEIIAETPEPDSLNRLGHHYLGEDFVCGNSFKTEQPTYNITFGPVGNSNILDYFCGDKKDVLKMIYDLFVPADFVVKSKLLFDNNKIFTLDDSQKNNHLGYSTII